MGAMYKFLKHKYGKRTKSMTHSRDVELRATSEEPMDVGEKVDDSQTVEPQMQIEDIERKYTAEHILQLCKFLAEKSRKNRNNNNCNWDPPQKRQITFTEYQNESYESDDAVVSAPEHTEESEPLILQRRLSDNGYVDGEDNASIALTVKSTHETNNSVTTTSATSSLMSLTSQTSSQKINQSSTITDSDSVTATCAMEFNQGKRDVLLKIRRQIFERKRQKQLAHHHHHHHNHNHHRYPSLQPHQHLGQQRLGVWRPW